MVSQSRQKRDFWEKLTWSRHGDGIIVGKDVFRAATHSPEHLDEIGRASGYPYEIQEVDESSVFLVIAKK